MITLFHAPASRCALRTLSAAALAAMVMPLEQMPVQAAGPPVIEFDAPHASKVSAQICLPYCGTTAFDNNNLGDIVGTYTDRNIVLHGFLRLRDRFPSFDGPGAGLGANLDQGTVAYPSTIWARLRANFRTRITYFMASCVTRWNLRATH